MMGTEKRGRCGGVWGRVFYRCFLRIIYISVLVLLGFVIVFLFFLVCLCFRLCFGG